MVEDAPRVNFDAGLVLKNLLDGRINPSQASRAFMAGYIRQGLSREDIRERINDQHQVFHEANYLTQPQMVSWDDVVICIEIAFHVAEDERISRNRLVPIGTQSEDIDFRYIPF